MHINVHVGISSDRKEISLWKLEVFANSLSPLIYYSKYLAQITIIPCETDLICVILCKQQKSRKASRALAVKAILFESAGWTVLC